MLVSNTAMCFRYGASSVEIMGVIGRSSDSNGRRKTRAKYYCSCFVVVSTGKIVMLVSMRWSEKFGIPRDVALLYDFANSLDPRRYVERGVTHDPGDELATPAQLKDWLQTRGLLKKGGDVSRAEHRGALQLRDALRTFFAASPADRMPTVGPLAVAAARFPLQVAPSGDRALDLRPVAGRATSGLGQVLVQLLRLS